MDFFESFAEINYILADTSKSIQVTSDALWLEVEYSFPLEN